MYKYTSNFDFRRLNKYEDANDDLHIDDLILDYTMLYEFYKKRTKKLQKENKRLNNIINEFEQWTKDSKRETLMGMGTINKIFFADELLNKLKEIKGEE
jgi:hypothetical protein